MPDSLDNADATSIFTVDTLIKYMGNDDSGRAIVAKIVRDALVGAEQPMLSAAAAVRAGRYTEAARALHGLRGSIGTLGTKRFVTASLALELAIAENRFELLPDLLAEVQTQFDVAVRTAQAWLLANAGT